MSTIRGGPGEAGSAFDSREMAEAWRREGAARNQVLRPATELMLDLAGIGPGLRVLDIAAGTGDQTILAARRVGPGGSVLATDIAAPMLELAADAAREAGLANVEVRVMGAEQLELESDAFDAAISRNGLQFVSDLGAALAEIRRVLRPGGRLAAIVWASPDQNPFQGRPLAVVNRRVGVPFPTPGPGIFGLADPGALAHALRQAAFREVAVQTIAAVRRFASLDEAVAYHRAVTPPLLALIARLDEVEREAAWAEIAQELREFVGPDGFAAPSESLVGVGTR